MQCLRVENQVLTHDLDIECEQLIFRTLPVGLESTYGQTDQTKVTNGLRHICDLGVVEEVG